MEVNVLLAWFLYQVFDGTKFSVELQIVQANRDTQNSIVKDLHSFYAIYLVADKKTLESFGNLLLLGFSLLWDLFDPTFT